MEYLTLHELARHFNKPERQIRYRFRELTKAGKLTEGEDFWKEDFVDEFHFGVPGVIAGKFTVTHTLHSLHHPQPPITYLLITGSAEKG